MTSARWTFWIAAVWGFITLPPMYFIEKRFAAENPPAITHPEFYYGFISCALAFQAVFVVIARDPIRHRAMMIPAMIEKFGWFFVVSALHVRQPALGFGIVDLFFGIFFVMAYLQTPKA